MKEYNPMEEAVFSYKYAMPVQIILFVILLILVLTIVSAPIIANIAKDRALKAEAKAKAKIEAEALKAEKVLEAKEKAWKTKGNIFTDSRDGKSYRIVRIGSQFWMSENLNYKISGSQCYDNAENNCQKYGRLYNWETAMKVCPKGWHLPSKSELEVLEKTVGSENVAGKKLKSKSGWNMNGNGTDEFGFAALPGGGCVGHSSCSFSDVGYGGHWWLSSTSEHNANNALRHGMSNGSESIYWNFYGKSNLFSVRCVQD